MGFLYKFDHKTEFNDNFNIFTDVLNVSGKFNSDELSRDMSVGDDVKDEPFFEQRDGVKSPQNVSALIGKTAFLSCIVRNLGKAKSVSNQPENPFQAKYDLENNLILTKMLEILCS